MVCNVNVQRYGMCKWSDVALSIVYRASCTIYLVALNISPTRSGDGDAALV